MQVDKRKTLLYLAIIVFTIFSYIGGVWYFKISNNRENPDILLKEKKIWGEVDRFDVSSQVLALDTKKQVYLVNLQDYTFWRISKNNRRRIKKPSVIKPEASFYPLGNRRFVQVSQGNMILFTVKDDILFPVAEYTLPKEMVFQGIRYVEDNLIVWGFLSSKPQNTVLYVFDELFKLKGQHELKEIIATYIYPVDDNYLAVIEESPELPLKGYLLNLKNQKTHEIPCIQQSTLVWGERLYLYLPTKCKNYASGFYKIKVEGLKEHPQSEKIKKILEAYKTYDVVGVAYFEISDIPVVLISYSPLFGEIFLKVYGLDSTIEEVLNTDIQEFMPPIVLDKSPNSLVLSVSETVLLRLGVR